MADLTQEECAAIRERVERRKGRTSCQAELDRAKILAAYEAKCTELEKTKDRLSMCEQERWRNASQVRALKEELERAKP